MSLHVCLFGVIVTLFQIGRNPVSGEWTFLLLFFHFEEQDENIENEWNLFFPLQKSDSFISTTVSGKQQTEAVHLLILQQTKTQFYRF